MSRSTACLPTCCLSTLRLPYERAGQIFEILFQETWHVGGYRHNRTEGYGAGKPSNAPFRLACPLAPNAASATLPAPSLPASSNVQQNASNR
jgi:hypothetical protein